MAPLAPLELSPLSLPPLTPISGPQFSLMLTDTVTHMVDGRTVNVTAA